MINVSYFKKKVQDVHFGDLMSFFPMILARIVSPLYKKKYKNTWIITEDGKEARDNGYWFFRMMVENHPDQPCVYAIDKRSPDYKKVKDLGKVIQAGSLKHWILYFVCAHNISSQKGGKPNAPMCSFIELNNWFNAHNIFLQHGVIINEASWLFADRSRFELFVASALPEKEYIEKYFGYPKGTVVLTGLPRFDNLHGKSPKKNQVVIMPSWRSWFTLKSQHKSGLVTDFCMSEYYIKWREFLESDQLDDMIDKYELEVYFYPHRNMQEFLFEFQRDLNSKVKIASWKEYDIQQLLITSSLMITDYSSVFFDMVYMKKPVIFYQFDLEDFRCGQYKQGYFDYSNNPFTKCYSEADGVFHALNEYILNNFNVDDEFESAHAQFFPLYDSRNSERVFDAIVQMDNQ